ncbi:MAG: hypothetical protein M1820_008109 [Bogoriella megaspora]|nr:MAG: hypothetical protein M1820_008109 [Bogoriella megaspora]
MDTNGVYQQQPFEDLITSMDSLNEKELQNDSVARARIAASARRLCQRLESPWERIARMVWAEPLVAIATQIAIKSNLFQALHEQDSPRTANELAEITKTDPNVIHRMARILATVHILEKREPDAYVKTPTSEAMLSATAGSGMNFLFNVAYPYYAEVPDFYRENGYKTHVKIGPFQKHFKMEVPIYDWLAEHPDHMSDFVGLMKVWDKTQEPWVDLYPTEVLLEGSSQERAVLVDVAGGGGRDIDAFLQKHPQTAGRLVLQDRAEVLETAKIGEGIERKPHDFFTAQPVKGARAYFMHSVLHNWSDEDARNILGNLKRVMQPGYSKILVYEDTIRDKNPTELGCGMDLTMLLAFGNGGRTESEWKTLFDSAGLKPNKIYHSGRGDQCLMELESESEQ